MDILRQHWGLPSTKDKIFTQTHEELNRIPSFIKQKAASLPRDKRLEIYSNLLQQILLKQQEMHKAT